MGGGQARPHRCLPLKGGGGGCAAYLSKFGSSVEISGFAVALWPGFGSSTSMGLPMTMHESAKKASLKKEQGGGVGSSGRPARSRLLLAGLLDAGLLATTIITIIMLDRPASQLGAG